MENLKRIMPILPSDIDAAIVTDVETRFWLTGFHSTAGTLIFNRQTAVFIIDFRYIEAARAALSNGCEVLLQEKLGAQIIDTLKKLGAKRVGFADDKVSVREAGERRALLKDFECVFSKELSQSVVRTAMVKTPREIALMQKAQDITDTALANVMPYVRVGTSEKELAARIEFEMKLAGATGVSFDFIVVSGSNSSMPHGVPTEKKIADGEFVTMDIGAIYNGYCADMTRTVAVGSASEEMKKVYDTVLTAQLAAIAAVKPGMVCREIDKIARDIIYSAGYEGCFGHGLGHSLGVQVHEPPAFNPKDETVLCPDMFITVEPGIYLPGRFGVRIEDVVRVTENGCVNITHSPKMLQIV